jgi:hypothetical protein
MGGGRSAKNGVCGFDWSEVVTVRYDWMNCLPEERSKSGNSTRELRRETVVAVNKVVRKHLLFAEEVLCQGV